MAPGSVRSTPYSLQHQHAKLPRRVLRLSQCSRRVDTHREILEIQRPPGSKSVQAGTIAIAVGIHSQRGREADKWRSVGSLSLFEAVLMQGRSNFIG